MGADWGDFGGGASEADQPGHPDPDELELVIELVDDDPMPGDEPNSARSDRETIGGSTDADARLIRFPRGVRIAGVITAAVALTVAAWPAPGGQEAVPQPVPTPPQVNVDLYKVRLGTTTLDAEDGSDHAVLGLQLTNGAAAPLEVVSAELWDAVDTRIGSATMWPAEGLGPGSTVSVPVKLPYSCDDFGYLPVLPLTIRYSISTVQHPDAGHDYAYPLADFLWDTYMRQRVAKCLTADDAISATAIDTTQPIGAPNDPAGFDLTFTVEAAGGTGWSVDEVASTGAGVSVTGDALPVVVSPGQTAHVSTHWHVDDCSHLPRWSEALSGVEFTARPTVAPAGRGAGVGAGAGAGAHAGAGADAGGGTGTGAGAGAAQRFRAELRPGLVTEMLQVACGG